MLDGHNLPIFFARKLGEDFSYAAAHGLIGTDFDSLTGQWASQGPNLYLLARLHECPRMTVAKVLDEYYSAFGPAAAAVRAYFAHWEKVSDAVTDDLAKEAELHWASFYRDADRIFTPGVLATGRDLLEKAAAAAQSDPVGGSASRLSGKRPQECRTDAGRPACLPPVQARGPYPTLRRRTEASWTTIVPSRGHAGGRHGLSAQKTGRGINALQRSDRVGKAVSRLPSPASARGAG